MTWHEVIYLMDSGIGVRGGGSGQVFRESTICSKIPNDKRYFNTVKNFRAHSVLQGKHRLLKNPECKQYIQYSEFRATLFFRSSAKLLKIPD